MKGKGGGGAPRRQLFCEVLLLGEWGEGKAFKMDTRAGLWLTVMSQHRGRLGAEGHPWAGEQATNTEP